MQPGRMPGRLLGLAPFLEHGRGDPFQLVELLLIETRGGRLLWSGVYSQSATAWWKTAALTETESVAEILRDILGELRSRVDA